jgi:hypothetical protein
MREEVQNTAQISIGEMYSHTRGVDEREFDFMSSTIQIRVGMECVQTTTSSPKNYQAREAIPNRLPVLPANQAYCPTKKKASTTHPTHQSRHPQAS